MSISGVIHYLNESRSVRQENSVADGSGRQNEETQHNFIGRLDLGFHEGNRHHDGPGTEQAPEVLLVPWQVLERRQVQFRDLPFGWANGGLRKPKPLAIIPEVTTQLVSGNPCTIGTKNNRQPLK